MIAHQGNQPPDVCRRQFVSPEADHPPSCQRGLQVFFQIGGETRAAVVVTMT